MNQSLKHKVDFAIKLLQSIDFKQNPRMLRLYIKNANIYYRRRLESKGDNNPIKDGFDCMAYQLYCDNMYQYIYKTFTLFGKFDWKSFLEDEFQIDLNGI